MQKKRVRIQFRRAVALLLTVLLCLSCNVTVFAAEADAGDTAGAVGMEADTDDSGTPGSEIEGVTQGTDSSAVEEISENGTESDVDEKSEAAENTSEADAGEGGGLISGEAVKTVGTAAMLSADVTLWGTLDDESSMDEVFTAADSTEEGGTSENPFLIQNENDLVTLRQLANGAGSESLQSDYNHGSGWHFQVSADITVTTAWIEGIGGDLDHYFAGTFDGNGKTISALKVSAEAAAGSGTKVYAGLFGYTSGAAIKNVKLSEISVNAVVSTGSSTTTASKAYAGALVAYANNTAISGCSLLNGNSETAVSGVAAANADGGDAYTYAGGIAGYYGAALETGETYYTMSGCSSEGTVSAEATVDSTTARTLSGGIVGLAEGTILKGCSSSAAVSSKNGTKATISQSNPDGFINGGAGGIAGGAAGLYVSETTQTGMSKTTVYTPTRYAQILDCSSVGNVENLSGDTLSAFQAAGGIVGTTYGLEIQNSTYKGNVKSIQTAGGIIGLAGGLTVTVDSCRLLEGSSVNTVGVSTTGRTRAGNGGIVGYMYGSSSLAEICTIKNCSTEAGAALESEYAYGTGGIVGYAICAAVENCTNGADINKKSDTGNNYYTGGIAGVMTTSSSRIENCRNTASVSASSNYAGGIAGSLTAGNILNSENTGEINYTREVQGTSTAASNVVGGIVGSSGNAANIIDSCTNSGLITVTAGDRAGGIAGTVGTGGTIRNCVNSGKISAGKVNSIGGIAGYLNKSAAAVAINNYNLGDLEEQADGNVLYIGGIIGYLNAGQAENNYSLAKLTPARDDTKVGLAVGGRGSTAANITIQNNYAQAQGSYSLIGDGEDADSCYTFDEDLKITLQDDETAKLVDLLNKYVVGELTGLYYKWIQDESGYPVFGDVKPAEPAVPTDLVAMAGSTLIEKNSQLTLANGTKTVSVALSARCADEVKFFIYKCEDRYGNGLEKTGEVAAEKSSDLGTAYTGSFTIDGLETGYQYYKVTAVGKNEYGYSSEEMTDVLTVYVQRASGDADYYGYADTEEFSLLTEGENSETNPYIIDTPQKLAYLSAQVNAGVSYEGKYFRQTADIDLGNKRWVPIGFNADRMFQGNYDGNHFKVTGIFLKEEYDADVSQPAYGLFGYVSGSTIKDLTVGGSIVYDFSAPSTAVYQIYAGGVAGYVSGGTITGCSTEGMKVSVTKTNDVSISTSNAQYYKSYIGGLIGYLTGESSTIVNASTDEETVLEGFYVEKLSTAWFVTGGIAGYVNNGTVRNAENSAQVSGHCAGGIAGCLSGGAADGKIKISEAKNKGAINAALYGGGIVGQAYYYSEIFNSVNQGTVSVKGSNTSIVTCLGGIAGYMSGDYKTGSDTVIVWNCQNSGKISGGNDTGGIVGDLANASVYNSYNTGETEGVRNSSNRTGGLVGATSASSSTTGYPIVQNCYNAGKISWIENGTNNIVTGSLAGDTGSVASLSYCRYINCYYVPQEGVGAFGSVLNPSYHSSLGSFNSALEVTALEEYGDLEFSGDLLNLLNSWAVTYRNDQETFYGWKVENGGDYAYPVFDEEYDFDAVKMPAEPEYSFEDQTFDVGTENAQIKVDVLLDTSDGDVIGTVSYETYREETAIEGCSGILEPDENGKVSFIVPVESLTPGSSTYRVVVTNRTDLSYKTVETSAKIKIKKASDDNSWYGEVAEGFASGSGTEDDPYLIDDADQLAYLAQQVDDKTDTYSGKYIKLTKDIDLNGREWNSIGGRSSAGGRSQATYFSGVFDGGGHTISGLSITSNVGCGGLFGSASGATIKNLTVDGEVYTTSGTWNAGLLAYTAVNGVTIENCVNLADVTGMYGIGGILGYATGTAATCVVTIRNSCNLGTITANTSSNFTSVGSAGIVGGMMSYPGSTVENCYNAGDIFNLSGKNTYIGGIVGYTTKNIEVKNCYNAGTLQGAASYTGAVYGTVGSGSTVSNCYYLDESISGVTNPKANNATACTALELSRLTAALNGEDAANEEAEGEIADDSPDVWQNGGGWCVTIAADLDHVTLTDGSGETLSGSEGVITAAKGYPYPIFSYQTATETDGSFAFAVSASSGYELSGVTADDVTITADEDGLYHLTDLTDVPFMDISVILKNIKWKSSVNVIGKIFENILNKITGEGDSGSTDDEDADFDHNGTVDVEDLLGTIVQEDSGMSGGTGFQVVEGGKLIWNDVTIYDKDGNVIYDSNPDKGSAAAEGGNDEENDGGDTSAPDNSSVS